MVFIKGKSLCRNPDRLMPKRGRSQIANPAIATTTSIANK